MQESLLDQDIATEAEAAEYLPAETGVASAAKQMKKRKKKRKKLSLIIAAIVLLLLAALVIRLIQWSGKEAPSEILHDYVSRGSIASVVEGYGMTKSKNSESISVTTSGTVVDVYVSEGEFVAEGTVLYVIDSPAAQDAVNNAQKDVEGYQKQLRTLYEAKANLQIKADFAGKILGAPKLQAGEAIGMGELLGYLVDDSKMKLTQYYSYAYEAEIYLGQPALISVPAVMQQLSGSVSEIKKVERISPEGSRLFRVEITMNNPGTLTEGLFASALLSGSGEQISPYEQGELEYNRSMEIKSKVSGEVEWTDIENYMKVSAGQLLMRVSGEDNENEIFTLEDNLKKAREALEEAQKNRDNLQAAAPIDGTVMGLAISPGEEIAANTAVISIVDASQILVEADVDERNIGNVKVGDPVEIQDWNGNVTFGEVETVSLSGKFENGITSFPVTIVVDNQDGMLMSAGGVTYKLSAQKSEDCLLVQLQSVKSVAHPETGKTINVLFVRSDFPPEGALEIDGTQLGVPEQGYYAVEVEVGISDNYNVEIKSGVDEGAEVFCQVLRDQANSWYY